MKSIRALYVGLQRTCMVFTTLVCRVHVPIDHLDLMLRLAGRVDVVLLVTPDMMVNHLIQQVMTIVLRNISQFCKAESER